VDDQARRQLSAAAETAVVVLAPAAEQAVSRYRRRLDVAASWGVPAHVTVIPTFVAPGDVDDEVLAGLATAVARVPSFACVFRRTAWFGEGVLWLAPEPDEGFLALIRSVQRSFPGHLPYGGAYGDPVPHLTVAQRRLEPLAVLREAEAAVAAALPIEISVTTAVLLAGRPAPQSWSIVEKFPSGPNGA
jgi:2'-5' RNA ligase